MAKAKKEPTSPTPPTSFELLGMRVQKIINSTGAQTAKRAVIYKAPDELRDDWDELLEAIDEADNVTIAHQMMVVSRSSGLCQKTIDLSE